MGDCFPADSEALPELAFYRLAPTPVSGEPEIKPVPLGSEGERRSVFRKHGGVSASANVGHLDERFLAPSRIVDRPESSPRENRPPGFNPRGIFMEPSEPTFFPASARGPDSENQSGRE